jgi:uncharacterized protein with PIN domain
MEAPRPRVTLDANAVIALFRDEPAAARVEEVLDATDARMSTVNAAEVVDVLSRRYGWRAADVIVALEQLGRVVELTPATLEVAVHAGELRARHWRRDQRVSLAHCFTIATARPGERIVTLDGTQAAVARAEGYEVVELA